MRKGNEFVYLLKNLFYNISIVDSLNFGPYMFFILKLAKEIAINTTTGFFTQGTVQVKYFIWTFSP